MWAHYEKVLTLQTLNKREWGRGRGDERDHREIEKAGGEKSERKTGEELRYKPSDLFYNVYDVHLSGL